MQAIDDLKNLQSAAGLFFQAAAHALRGERLPSRLDQQLRFLLANGA